MPTATTATGATCPTGPPPRAPRWPAPTPTTATLTRTWLLLSACEAARKTLEVLKREETIASVAPHVMSFKQFFDTARMAEVQELEARYGTPENSRTDY